MTRQYRSFLSYIQARCLGCGFWLDSPNAHGLAVQHHDRTGHQIAVEYTRTVLYGVKLEAAQSPAGRAMKGEE